jgi:hypothetical protein
MSLHLQELGRKLGRRVQNRFAIAGATISWIMAGQEHFSDETMPLSDIGRGGLSFLSNKPPAIGSDLALRIYLPKKSEALDVYGKVVYSISRGPRLTYSHRVGVEFAVPGQSDRSNSDQTTNTVAALERTYGRRAKLIKEFL